ncbi:type I-D CRISPR-associated protein Cas7/Csc2 [Hazenella sp. IB182353]|uniref:type I-D CRISPR-associated protein Cas7/Csc2 n=1 Tax=Polycladospora coralii TaxID=2771432 RepID=UPI0017466EBE|nr:type I-D CRISPR-associated protein Cas7/Csc2 [Polycladospora coralii]MBS7531168.1 type I-D CRISPR-associated protein Cas7/Csc2 [Polycladospora coralii]
MLTTHLDWNQSEIKEKLDRYFFNEVPLAPQRQYAQIVLLREFESTAVLTTEGQFLDVELVRGGQTITDTLSRVLFQKRKQVAPERRTGRAFNRSFGINEKCQYMRKMCGECPDCLLYGFAATEGEGSQRSRILTDSGFSIRPYEVIQRSITLNAIDDTTTGGVSGSAFAEREHIRPQVYFPTIETAVDVTSSEFLYILRNILTTTRYGAESQRQGYIRNIPVAILFGQSEILSNLSLVQHLYDKLYCDQNRGIETSLDRDELIELIKQVLTDAQSQSYLPVQIMMNEELEQILSSIREIWKSKEANDSWLQQLQKEHQTYKKKVKPKKEKKEEK